MKFKPLITPIFSFFLLSIQVVNAHCPLCTMGAAAVAVGAAWYGVKTVIIGLFIGAFAVSMGYWISNMIKRQFIPFQRSSIILLSFVTTIIPLLSVIKDVTSFYVSFAGDYGSLLNRTYLINIFLVGSIFGGILVVLAPLISNKITQLRNGKILPFQGTILTILMLVVASIILQKVI